MILIVDINADVKEFGDDFDYRGRLRDSEWVTKLAKSVVGTHEKLVQRGRVPSFDSKAPVFLTGFSLATIDDRVMRAWRNRQTQRTQTKLECSPGNWRCRTAQIRGNVKWQSRAKPGATLREGVATRRAAPKPERMFAAR